MGSSCSLGRGSRLCSASNLKWQRFQKAVWLCVLVRKKKGRERERAKNKTKTSPRSLHKCVHSHSAVSHSLQHKVCSNAKDACTFLSSRRTVKADSAGYDIYPAPTLHTSQPACPSQRLTPRACPGSTLGIFLTSSANWNVCFIQEYDMEFKWLWTLKWGQNRLADDFPADLCRNQNNGKDREWNGTCISWVYQLFQQWNPLQEIIELWKGPSHFKAADLNSRGYRRITGKDFQMTTLPTLRASEVPFNCSAGWISCFCSPDPSSLTLLCTRVNYITRLPCPPISGCLQPTGGSGMMLWGRREWDQGIYSPGPSLPSQPGLLVCVVEETAPTRWLLPLLLSGLCWLFSSSSFPQEWHWLPAVTCLVVLSSPLGFP